MPTYVKELQNHNSELGKLNDKYQIQSKLTTLLSSKGSSLVGGVLGAGELVAGTFSEVLGVIVLTIYFLAGLPSIKLFFYRLIPHSRRPRVILITDQITIKVGGYVLGNLLTSVIAGLGTYIWMIAFGIPYPALLGLLVAILDLIPVVGSTVGGVHRHPGRPDRSPCPSPSTRWPSTSATGWPRTTSSCPASWAAPSSSRPWSAWWRCCWAASCWASSAALVAIPVAAAHPGDPERGHVPADGQGLSGQAAPSRSMTGARAAMYGACTVR